MVFEFRPRGQTSGGPNLTFTRLPSRFILTHRREVSLIGLENFTSFSDHPARQWIGEDQMCLPDNKGSRLNETCFTGRGLVSSMAGVQQRLPRRLQPRVGQGGGRPRSDEPPFRANRPPSAGGREMRARLDTGYPSRVLIEANCATGTQ